MLFRQYVDPDLGCASYLVGDEEAREAVLVDPAYAIEPYLEEAGRFGVRIAHVIETHTHADHVSGHGRLALEHGIPVAVHSAANAGYPNEPLEDGSEVEAGSLRLRILHTPGHRPEHCCVLAGSHLMTGDSLFVGAAARPDLAVESRTGAEGLFYSLRRLMELPDDVRVFPGHVAGSLCGTGMSSDPSSTIGAERRFNPALALSLVEEFVNESSGVSVPRPPNMERIVELNRGPFLGAPPALEPRAEAGGATVLDVRPALAYATGHVPGALNVPVTGGSFGTKAGFVLRPGERIVLHAASEEEAGRAARGLRAVGLLEVEGYLADPSAEEVTEPVGLDELERLLAAGTIDLIDVRELGERDSGYIAGSRHIPYRLLRAYGDDLCCDRPVVTVCESGARAAIAASILAANGIEARPVLEGGIGAWQQRGKRTIEFRRCGS